MVTRKRTGKVPIRTGTDVEILTSLTLYLILRSKKDCIYQDKFRFILDGPYSAGFKNVCSMFYLLIERKFLPTVGVWNIKGKRCLPQGK